MHVMPKSASAFFFSTEKLQLSRGHPVARNKSYNSESCVCVFIQKTVSWYTRRHSKHSGVYGCMLVCMNNIVLFYQCKPLIHGALHYRKLVHSKDSIQWILFTCACTDEQRLCWKIMKYYAKGAIRLHHFMN